MSNAEDAKDDEIFFLGLPRDLWVETMSHLALRELLMISETCKKLHKYSSSDELWKEKHYSIPLTEIETNPSQSLKSLVIKSRTEASYPTLRLEHMNWIQWNKPSKLYDPKLQKQRNDKFRFLKFLIVGDACVGKTSVLHQFVQESCMEEFSPDFRTRRVILHQQVLKLQVFDSTHPLILKIIAANKYSP